MKFGLSPLLKTPVVGICKAQSPNPAILAEISPLIAESTNSSQSHHLALMPKEEERQPHTETLRKL